MVANWLAIRLKAGNAGLESLAKIGPDIASLESRSNDAVGSSSSTSSFAPTSSIRGGVVD